MYEHDIALAKIQLAKSFLGQLHFDDLRRAFDIQFDPDPRSSREKIPDRGLHLGRVRTGSGQLEIMGAYKRDFLLTSDVRGCRRRGIRRAVQNSVL